ncbi:coiled-coil domain-containing protein 12 [Anopheles ziemanni]|uniref:coiled-coil domain-containing protein 12 n=1 Tax=Anopheles coustani TaxID=139045 RepID=UPI00265A9ECC|nr:coiled-coil domain-containing protein 12 [Anopheles coustani]XP_058171436.1 coiled-coil domain-containing protein 12 [Anopheles ziemanni]
MMSAIQGKLEEEALRRKERLRELARKSVAQKDDRNDAAEKSNVPKPIFRNYKPECAEIQDASIEDGHVGDVQTEVTSQLEMMGTPIVIEDIDIVNLAPRKPDWDLKRDVSKKLEKLERRTQKAIAELIRERLKEGQGQDILQAVNVASLTTSANRTLNDPNGED